MPLGKVLRNSPTFEPKDTRPTLWVRPDRGVSLFQPSIVAYDDFSNGAWVRTGISGVVTNSTTDPDGTSLADKLVEDTATSAHKISQTIANMQTGIPTHFVVSAKADNRSWIWVQADGTAFAYVNLSNGAIGSTFGSPITVTRNRGNGWYDVDMYVGNPSSYTYTIGLATGDGGSVYAGNDVGSVYLHNAQVLQDRVINITNMGTSGPILDFKNSLTTVRPQLSSSLAFAQQNGIEFNGSTQHLYTTASLANVVSTTAWTAFYVAKSDTLSSYGVSYAEDPVFIDSGGYFWLAVSSSTQAIAGNYVAGVQDVRAGTYTTGVLHIVEAYKIGGTGYVRVDNGQMISASMGTTSGTGNILFMGAFGTSQYFDGTIFELVLYNRAVGPEERARVRAYLSNRYGIPALLT